MIFQQNSKVVLSGKDFYHLVSPDQIVYCQKEKAYTQVFLNDNSSIVVPVSLRKTSGVLGKLKFIRVHRSYLVNVNYIKGFQFTGSCEITLESDQIIPVSKFRKKHVERFLEKHIRIQID